MIQDIAPSRLDNSYKDLTPADDDTVVVFDDQGKILADIRDSLISFSTAKDHDKGSLRYLFSIDDKRYFLAETEGTEGKDNNNFFTIRQLRDSAAGVDLYAAFTAYHLWKWYHDNKYCPICKEELVHDGKERVLKCEKCGNMIYPRINPAVIVGVTNGDSILVTRYRQGYAHNALIAGFAEIGETLEETVAREVMEEAGIKVKNIRYYKSQPWGMAQDLLVGFYCEADGDTTIKMDDNELRYAAWTKREDIVLQPNDLSLTNEMMKMFMQGKA